MARLQPKVFSEVLIKDIDKYYNDSFILKNKPIKKHHQKYLNDKYAPAWKTLEFFSFGIILKIFKNLKTVKLKKEFLKNLEF